MTRAAERLFALVRATLRNRMDDASLFEGTDAAQWREIYDLSSVQGVLAQAWDGINVLYLPIKMLILLVSELHERALHQRIREVL